MCILGSPVCEALHGAGELSGAGGKAAEPMMTIPTITVPDGKPEAGGATHNNPPTVSLSSEAGTVTLIGPNGPQQIPQVHVSSDEQDATAAAGASAQELQELLAQAQAQIQAAQATANKPGPVSVSRAVMGQGTLQHANPSIQVHPAMSPVASIQTTMQGRAIVKCKYNRALFPSRPSAIG